VVRTAEIIQAQICIIFFMPFFTYFFSYARGMLYRIYFFYIYLKRDEYFYILMQQRVNFQERVDAKVLLPHPPPPPLQLTNEPNSVK
jgi:hypothetical protein